MSPRLLLCALALPLSSCGLFQKPAYQEQGMASYIADHFNGRMTTSGQIYSPYAYTAAHYSLPFGTVVNVENLQTGREVKVTVNDRFPYHHGRVINLSSAAAQYIGIPYQRMAQVKVTARTVANNGGQYNNGYAHSPQRKPQHRPAPAYQAKKKQPARKNYGAPAYGNQTLPAFNGAAPQYRPPPQAPTYQPQPPANNGAYLPGFNSGAPPAGAGLR